MDGCRRWLAAGTFLALVALGGSDAAGQNRAPAAAAQAPAAADPAGTDPIRCWWQTDKGAVRTGEPFTLLLTCAVLDNDTIQVVPDESRLASAVVQLSPFEVMGGEHPADLRTPTRRFFQYTYRLRIINPDLVGRDIRIPDITMHYRVSSRVGADSSLQGRDQTYLLPEHWVKVLSLVPFEASDIRDTKGSPFGATESLTYRANVLRLAGVSLVVLGVLMALISLIRVLAQLRGRSAVTRQPLQASGVKRLALRELASVRKAAGSEGWSETLVGRAAAATRLASSLAVGRSIDQRPAHGSAEGRVLFRVPWRRFTEYAFSGSATTADLDRTLASLPESAPARTRRALEELRGALDAFTGVGYGPSPSLDGSTLDAALAQAVSGAQAVRVPWGWPLSLLRFGNQPPRGSERTA